MNNDTSPLPSFETLRFRHATVVLNSESAEVRKLSADYFREYLLTPRVDAPKWTVDDCPSYGACEDAKGVFSRSLDQTGRSWSVNEANRHIKLTATSHDPRFAMRIVRSLNKLEDMASGGIMFKGAALTNRNGCGIVLMGAKRSGKTSLLLGSLLEDGSECKFVTNSHLTLHVTDNMLTTHGYPISVGVRINTLESMAKRGARNVEPLIAEMRATMVPGDENRYYLDPEVLRRVFCGRIQGTTATAAIVVMRSIPSHEKPSLKSVAINDKEQFFFEHHSKYFNRGGSHWYELFPVDKEKQTQTIRRALSLCRIYELTYNSTGHNRCIDLMNSIA